MPVDTTGAGSVAGTAEAPPASANGRRSPVAGRTARRQPPRPRAAFPSTAPRAERIAEALLGWARRHPVLLCMGVLTVAVVAFTGAWPGDIVLDGTGTVLHLQLAVDHLQRTGAVPYWTPEMWAGTPTWALAPSLPYYALLPIALVIGATNTVKVATLGAQILGGVGAFVLARSLWSKREVLLPLAIGFIYALHPLLISHAALFGESESIFVMATAPWLVWSLRRALRGEGYGPAALAGLLLGLCVLEQAENTYALLPLIACQGLLELWRARGGRKGEAVRHLLRTAAVVVGVAFGIMAFWLLPFVSLSKSFILTPPTLARSQLVREGSQLGREPGAFLDRAKPVHTTVTYALPQSQFPGDFYLSWVCVALTMVTVMLLPRHDEDGHLTAVMIGAGIDIWLSTAGVPLAQSGPAERFQPVPFVIVGAVTGLLIGSFIRRVAVGRSALLWGTLGGLFIISMPYLAPLMALRIVVPGLSSLRFPRFYPLATLALSFGAVYPLRFVRSWARRVRPDLAPLVVATCVLALLGAFLVDVNPYKSFYRVHGIDGTVAYQQAKATLSAVGTDFRVATSQFEDARQVASLVGTGFETSVGWPHPIASKQVWRLTAEPTIAPPFYQEAALGLSATAYIASEHLGTGAESGTVEGVELDRNPDVLPLARAYDHTVVVNDPSITPELATALAGRNISVVAGGQGVRTTLGSLAGPALDSPNACSASPPPGTLGDQLAEACALHNWIGVFAPILFVPAAPETGALFTAPANGLQGVSVWLDRDAGASQLVLHEVNPDGSLGAEVARATNAPFPGTYDDNGMAAFRFPPIPDSAGHTYAFLLNCSTCDSGAEPRIVVTADPRLHANLVQDGQLQKGEAAAFSLIYDQVAPAPPSATTVNATSLGAGHWRLRTTGSSASLVVLAEAYFPGWSATVDGHHVPVLEADGAFLGVAVGPGNHRIDLSYQPPVTAIVGRVITVATVLAVVVAGPYRRRRARRRAVPAGKAAR